MRHFSSINSNNTFPLQDCLFVKPISIFCFLDEKYLLVIFYLYTVHWNVKGYFGTGHKTIKNLYFLTKYHNLFRMKIEGKAGNDIFLLISKTLLCSNVAYFNTKIFLKDIGLLNLQFF